MADLFQATDLVTRNSVNARITDFNNTISEFWGRVNTARLGETLYENWPGTTGTVTLSKSAQDYDFIDIYYKNLSTDMFRMTTVAPKYYKKWQLWFSRYSDTDGYVTFDLKGIYVDGTSITTNHVGYGNINNSDSTRVRVENNLSISKVVGYKIII